MQWYAVPRSEEVSGDPEEPARAHRRAMERSDEVVQQLAVAKYALSVGDVARAIDAIDGAMGIARHSLSTLLNLVSPPDAPTRAGALVRYGAAGVVERPPEPRAPID